MTNTIDSISYLKSMYDLWEEKQTGKWMPIHDGSEEPTKPTESSWLSKLKSITCTWWLLPEWLHKPLHLLTMGKKTWTLTLYKDEPNIHWYLDIPYLLTWKEILCGGTDTDLDVWYKKLTGKGTTPSSKMKCTVSDKPLSGTTIGNGYTVLKKIEELSNGDDSTTYKDMGTQLHCWLCPYLKWLYGYKPDYLYLYLEPIK